MSEAVLWGVVAASSLVAGALVGGLIRIPQRSIGLLMGFGAGALISAVSFDLADEALSAGGADSLAVGLAVGALSYYLGDRALESAGRHGRRRRPHGADAEAGATALLLGALLDGIPEQAAIGLGLATGGQVGAALVAAVFISNVPESLASAEAMRQAGRPRSHVVRLWGAVGLVCVGATVLGYLVLEGVSGNVQGAVQGFAAGAILVMLTDAMIPEALKHGGRTTGLVTVLGFAVAVLLSQR